MSGEWATCENLNTLGYNHNTANDSNTFNPI